MRAYKHATLTGDPGAGLRDYCAGTLGRTHVNIRRDKQSKFWVLSSNQRVLYEGRRSPWDDQAIIRQALDREKSLGSKNEAAP